MTSPIPQDPLTKAIDDLFMIGVDVGKQAKILTIENQNDELSHALSDKDKIEHMIRPFKERVYHLISENYILRETLRKAITTIVEGISDEDIGDHEPAYYAGVDALGSTLRDTFNLGEKHE